MAHSRTFHVWLSKVMLLMALAWGLPIPARADQVAVAVAANFLGTLEQLAPLFRKATGHTLQISAGSSGQLVAQIKAGAPYDVFLSADNERPAQLAQEGAAVAYTRFVYAQGALVLWSRDAALVDAQGKLLKSKTVGKVALADPSTAPYGAAGKQVLEKLGVWSALNGESKIVLGTSVTQAYQFAATGAAQCGFVAYAQVLGGAEKGSLWRVPQGLYAPLYQEAILLTRAKGNAAASAFLKWLKQDKAALAAIRAAGYTVPR